jgi:hypothetical protein
MTDHPITPPPELVEQWVQTTESNDCIGAFPTNFEKRICTAAAQWGADQELEACVKWVSEYCPYFGDYPLPEDKLRAARRPKPPSLKEQALAALDDAIMRGDCITISDALPTLRRALEQLDD